MNNLSADHFNDENEDNSGRSDSELPILKYKDEIIQAVKENQFVIIHGETGCGKTTQVPQFLLQAGIHDDRIIGVTQPRKIAALSMAHRVAEEMGEPVGKTVGYEIRFDKKTSGTMKIKYMTDGILLNECILYEGLLDYGVIMIDEAHERAVVSDVLLGLLKMIATKRGDLKVIVSSATISVEKFREYFENAKIISVESRLFPVDIIYHGYCSDYIAKAAELVQDIQQREMKSRDQGNVLRGDVLVFLTGQDEIYQLCDLIGNIEGIVPLPLCSSIDFDSQKEVFLPVRPYEIKVVVATNIAETSLTIEGVKYVIDCGYVKQNRYNSKRGLEVLEDVRISKAQADQRKGRAGRTQPGICHRLYTKSTYDDIFKEEAVPEIFRKNLTEICLKLRSFKIDPKEYKFLDPPPQEELSRCDKSLIDLNLLTTKGELTSVGKSVALLPLDPILGKVLIASLNYQCTMDVVRIVSMFSEKMQYIFCRPRKYIAKADSKKKIFYDPGGDHFTLLNVYNGWKNANKSVQWCKDNFINGKTIAGVEQIIHQILNILRRNKIDICDKTSSGNREDVKKCFVSGYLRNVCIKQARDVYRRVSDGETFLIHGNSSLKDARPKIILFHDAIKSSKSFASGCLQLDEQFLRDNFKKELEIIKFPGDIDEQIPF